MVDIEEIMQRYVFLNDPNVKELTTKFGMIVVGLGLMTVAVAGAVTWAGDDGGGSGDVEASYADGQDHSDKEAGDEVQDCVPTEHADAWRKAHDDVLMENRLLDTEESGDWICFTYVK